MGSSVNGLYKGLYRTGRNNIKLFIDDINSTSQFAHKRDSLTISCLLALGLFVFTISALNCLSALLTIAFNLASVLFSTPEQHENLRYCFPLLSSFKNRLSYTLNASELNSPNQHNLSRDIEQLTKNFFQRHELMTPLTHLYYLLHLSHVIK